MDITELFKETDTGKLIDNLRKRTGAPEIGTIITEYDESQHQVMNKNSRPDKIVREGTAVEDGGNGIVERTEAVARINLAFQKLIVKRAAAFLFGNPVKYQAATKTPVQKQLYEGIKQILDAVKIDSFNRRLAREVFKATEAAECWFPVEQATEQYGFKSKYKLRVALFSPMRGDLLFPLFDDLGDLVAFSRQYDVTENGDTTTYFETWTADKYLQWKQGKQGWEEIKNVINIVGKIPIIYASQEATEWCEVQVLIERLEKLLSNFADTNDYHASPKIFVTGEVKGFAKKGESGAIIEGEKDTTAEYLAWQNAPDSVKLEITTLKEMIYTLTQTPDISFENLRNVGAISGVALKLMFMDAHLKVLDKLEIFDEYLQRRLNLLKAFCAKMNVMFANETNMVITPKVTPYIIDDDKALVETLNIANGGKPLVSTKTAVELAGMVDDVDSEYAKIQEEEMAAQATDIFNPTV